MADYLQTMRDAPGFVSLSGAPEEDILAAESKLSLTFSKEYHEYVSAFGAASYGSHELTGVCKSPRLNVVDVTMEERQKHPDLPGDWYVLEQLHIDDVSIWQSSSGEVYQIMPGARPVKICESFSEYVHG